MRKRVNRAGGRTCHAAVKIFLLTALPFAMLGCGGGGTAMVAPEPTTPQASLSLVNYDFGDQPVAMHSVAQPITLNNAGGGTLTITGMEITGDYSQSGNCGGSLAAGSACTVNVTFTPTVVGFRSGTLSITHNAAGSPSIVYLSGVGASAVPNLLVTPRTVALTYSTTQQFSTNVSNPTWSVDGIAGGSASVGLITGSGLYSPPGSVGTHTVQATSNGDSAQYATATVYITNNAGLFTQRGNNQRAGQNEEETVLFPNNVNSARFGKLSSHAVDGNIYAQPLYVANLDMGGLGVHNVVYVATEHDSVYALDADNPASPPLWQVSFINPAAGINSVSTTDVSNNLISPEYGITGTPVIDIQNGTLYVVAYTNEKGTLVYRLHALDIISGAEKLAGPVLIQASVPGTGDGSAGGSVALNPVRHLQRPGLLLMNGVVYIAFGSHTDTNPYHGWLLAYDAQTLQQVAVYNTTPNGGRGAIWQAGGGPAADDDGNLYVVTGNGTFDANTSGRADYGDSVIKLSPSGAVLDYFTPFNQSNLNTIDLDLGSGGPLLLPEQPGNHPHLLIAAGKGGSIYVLDRDNLGHFNAGSDSQIVQELVDAFPKPANGETNFSTPATWENNVYFCSSQDTVRQFKLNNGLLSATPFAVSTTNFNFPGASMTVSANDDAGGILWAIERPSESASMVLHAYDATNVGNELYNSNQAGARDSSNSPAVKFSVPTVVNGKVFVGTLSQLVVFGLLP
jgi:hypothetical protein